MAEWSDLSERAQTLLRVLIDRYIEEGAPVGSRTLSRVGNLNLSPATIRNVMADLEDLGLIRAPHTSAGRVPTELGYRFFVNSLLVRRNNISLDRTKLDKLEKLCSKKPMVIRSASRAPPRICFPVLPVMPAW